MTVQEVRVPDLGDFDSVEIVEVMVSAGDSVADDLIVVCPPVQTDTFVEAICNSVVLNSVGLGKFQTNAFVVFENVVFRYEIILAVTRNSYATAVLADDVSRYGILI